MGNNRFLFYLKKICVTTGDLATFYVQIWQFWFFFENGDFFSQDVKNYFEFLLPSCDNLLKPNWL